jgi:hypothetical protein
VKFIFDDEAEEGDEDEYADDDYLSFNDLI